MRLCKILFILITYWLLFPGNVSEAAILRQTTYKNYKFYVVEVEDNDNVKIELANGSRLIGIKSINYFAQNKKAIINGGFYKGDTTRPVGILYKDNELFSGPIYSRSALIKYKNGFYEIKNLSFEGYINSQIKVDNYNQQRLSKTQVIIYDTKWGPKVDSIFKEGILVIVQNNKVIEISKKGVPIPDKGFVIYGPESKLQNLKLGSTVNFEYTIPSVILEEVDFILGAGPKLVEKKKAVNHIAKENFSCISACYNAKRSAVAIKEGKLYLIATPHLMSLTEFGLILSSFGFNEAINLDGGGSTQLYFKGISYIQGRKVNNYIIVE